MPKILSLNNNEIEIIIRTVGVPLAAFGLQELIDKTGETENECRRLSNFLKNYRGLSNVKISINKDDLTKLVKVFDVSAEIVDPIEMSTIVGYSWEQAMEVSKKLHALQ